SATPDAGPARPPDAATFRRATAFGRATAFRRATAAASGPGPTSRVSHTAAERTDVVGRPAGAPSRSQQGAVDSDRRRGGRLRPCPWRAGHLVAGQAAGLVVGP